MPNRTFGTLHPTDGVVPMPADTVYTFVMTGGSSAQASDWITTSSSAGANASTGGAGIVRFTGFSTAGLMQAFDVNLFSTAAACPASGTSISSSGTSHSLIGYGLFQIPGNSTGFSVASLVSGYIRAEVWHK